MNDERLSKRYKYVPPHILNGDGDLYESMMRRARIPTNVITHMRRFMISNQKNEVKRDEALLQKMEKLEPDPDKHSNSVKGATSESATATASSRMLQSISSKREFDCYGRPIIIPPDNCINILKMQR